MAFIPQNAKWYIADIVMEKRIAGQRRNVVHVNTLLVRADSPQEAYEEARKLGREAAITYESSEGQTVRTLFRGLQGLNVVHDELEHGAELFYDELVGVAPERLKTMVQRKRDLAVFRPRLRSSAPNYMPGTVAARLRAAGFKID